MPTYEQWPDEKITDTLNVAFAPSPYQMAVYHHLLRCGVESNVSDGLINAVAGSGKTTTILNAAKLVMRQGRSWMFVAFGHDIAVEINRKLKEAGMMNAARTAHALGKIAIANLKKKQKKALQEPSDRKYRQVVHNYINGVVRPQTKFDDSHAYATISELTRLARLTLTSIGDIDALMAMADHYSVDLVNSIDRKNMSLDEIDARNREEKRLRALTLRAVKPVIDEADQLAEDTGMIDFTDMLWLPYRWNLTPYQSQTVLVDECQDLSAVQLDLILKLRKPGGSMVFVGDPKQAIFGFAGADNLSFNRIAEMTQATQLPLSICYRCPQSHIRLAQHIVPTIEPRANAPEGVIETIAEQEIAARVEHQKGKCLILCRLTAPLVGLCLKLIGQHIPAKVRGREIGEQLQHLIDDVANQAGFQWEKFAAWLEVYESAQLERLRQREGNEAQIQALSDRVQAVEACFTGFSAEETRTIHTFKAALLDLFLDTNPGVWLSTVHRAKGLEQEHIYILKPDKMPLSWPDQQAWEMEQEMNLRYVALTRSTHALYFVRDDEKAKPEPAATTTPTTPSAAPQAPATSSVSENVSEAITARQRGYSEALIHIQALYELADSNAERDHLRFAGDELQIALEIAELPGEAE